MKAVRLEGVGNIALREVGKPAAGPDDLLVRIEACGVCGTDRHLFHGEFPCMPPVTLGHEFSGIVEAIGTAVSDFSVGDRVTGDPNIACGSCPHCRAGRINLCHNLIAIGIRRDGGFAEYVVLPRKQAFSLPKDLKPTHGAFCEPLGCCLHGLDLAQIRPGSSVAVLGGGVIGLLTVQLARLAGATTIILSTRQ
ncbi:alcohol dehydrogenase catalytic domain-containing protein, partial [Mesorhizobium sp.]